MDAKTSDASNDQIKEQNDDNADLSETSQDHNITIQCNHHEALATESQ